MAVITLDKIIFRNNDSYLKMYKGSELIAEVESTPALDYLTFTALQAGSTVKFDRTGVTSEYSTNNGSTWASGDNVTVTLSNVGDKVLYRGVTNTPSSSVTTTAFTLTGQIKASGSVNSMINKDPDDVSLNNKNYAFRYYFNGQSALKDISELTLPATTLSSNCYNNMFRGCTGLTTIPENLLPATTLANYCYQSMFNSCSGLTTLPNNLLPATTLASNCYQGMFGICTRLTNVPTLPATTLADSCYYSMFSQCEGLTTIPANLLPATTLTQSCYYSMFFGCINLTATPTLPATTLTRYCYSSMFQGCSKLNKVVTYAQYISATNCLRSWLNNVSSTGNFYNLGGASYTSGTGGIPTGWIENTTPPPPPLTFTALQANSTVNFNRSGVTSEYSTDNGNTWNSADNITVTLSSIGDKVMYRGVTSTIPIVSTTAFTLTGQIKASGSVNSMINNNPDDTSLNSKTRIFSYYFYDQTALKDISDLILPATTLTQSCYMAMFRGCTGLTTLPENLLPATTLANYCYDSIFYGCTNITTTPTLPATTLANYCYGYMFYNCYKLNKVVTYAQDISADSCLDGWLYSVSSTGDFYNLGGATYTRDTSGIPSGWTEHTTL